MKQWVQSFVAALAMLAATASAKNENCPFCSSRLAASSSDVQNLSDLSLVQEIVATPGASQRDTVSTVSGLGINAAGLLDAQKGHIQFSPLTQGLVDQQKNGVLSNNLFQVPGMSALPSTFSGWNLYSVNSYSPYSLSTPGSSQNQNLMLLPGVPMPPSVQFAPLDDSWWMVPSLGAAPASI
jgi:hypothetical protein